MFNKILDFFHNIYGLIFCFHAVYLAFPLIKSSFELVDTDFFYKYNQLTIISYIYFTISSVINIYDKNWSFLYHHVVCMLILYYGYINPDYYYINWIAKNFLAEISTIALTFGKIIYIIQNFGFKISKKINYYNDFVFTFLFYLIRIIYLAPINIHYLIYNYDSFKNDTYGLTYFLCCSMVLLNIYWAYYIYGKLCRIIKNKNN